MRCLLPALVLLGSCQSPFAGLELRLQHLPPTPKDIVAAALEGSRLPLTHPTCQAAGTQSTDRNIARYLAGYLVEFARPNEANSIATTFDKNPDGHYQCRLFLRHAAGNDIWSWGLEFTARPSDGLVDPASFRCLGAG